MPCSSNTSPDWSPALWPEADTVFQRKVATGTACSKPIRGAFGPSRTSSSDTGIKPVLVVDTKWKRMAPRIDDPKQGISQGDVYQLMAYSQLYGCRDVMLLYPHHGDLRQNRFAPATPLHVKAPKRPFTSRPLS
jgi:hypothetical protein